MPRESIVEIPSGSGNKYRYAYDPSSKATNYLGPVGSAPDLGEAEFMDAIDPKDYIYSDEEIISDLHREDLVDAFWIAWADLPMEKKGEMEAEWAEEYEIDDLTEEEFIKHELPESWERKDDVVRYMNRWNIPWQKQFRYIDFWSMGNDAGNAWEKKRNLSPRILATIGESDLREMAIKEFGIDRFNTIDGPLEFDNFWEGYIEGWQEATAPMWGDVEPYYTPPED